MAFSLSTAQFTSLHNAIKDVVSFVEAVDAAESSGGVIQEWQDLLDEIDIEDPNAANLTNNLSALRTSMASMNETVSAFMLDILNAKLVDQAGLPNYFASITEAVDWLRYLMGYGDGTYGYGVERQAVEIDGCVEGDNRDTGKATPNSTGGGDPFDNAGNADVIVCCVGVIQNVTNDGTDGEPTQTWIGDTQNDAQLEEGLIADNYTVRCSSDQYTGASAGAETLEVTGTRPVTSVPYGQDYNNAGLALTLGIKSSVNGNLLSNGGFETTTGTSGSSGFGFDNWTLDTGTDSSSWLLETSTVARGDNAIKLTKNGAGEEPKISQAVTLEPLTKYVVGLLLQCEACTGGTPLLKVRLEGTGWSQAGGQGTEEKLDIDISSAVGTWTRYYFVINTPENVPDDCELTIEVDDVSTGDDVWLDEVVVTEMESTTDGLWIAALAGTTDVEVNDLWSFTTVNDRSAKIQALFTRFWNYVLPSHPVAVAGNGGYLADP